MNIFHIGFSSSIESNAYLNPCYRRKYSIIHDSTKNGIIIGRHEDPKRNIPGYVWAPPDFGKSLPWRQVIREIGVLTRSPEWSVLLMKKLNRSTVYFDIGANCGITSLPVAVIPAKHQVYAFEPVPSMMDLLCASRELGEWQYEDRLHLIETAVSDSIGRMSIFIPNGRADNAAIGATKRVATLNVGGDAKKIEVQSITIDKFMKYKNISRISLLKIDTQGHELFVLRGAKNALRRHLISAVVAERDLKIMSAAGVLQEHIDSFMKSVRYTAYPPNLDYFDVIGDKFVKSPSAVPIQNTSLPYAFQDFLWLPDEA